MEANLSGPWMTVDEAAGYARVTREMIIRWIDEGLLTPAVTRRKKNLKAPGNPGYVIERNDLDQVMHSLRRNVVREATAETESQPKKGRVRAARSSRSVSREEFIRQMKAQ